MRGSGDAAFEAQVAWNGSLFFASYTPTRSGRHELEAFFRSDSELVHISGSPFLLVVEPSRQMCASRSVVSGEGLTLATAGELATFAIAMRDSFNGEVLSDVSRLSFAIDDTLAPSCSVTIEPTAAFIRVSYVTTKSGIYPFRVCSGNGNGLAGEYFGNVKLENKLFDQVDPEVDFRWVLGRLGTPLIFTDYTAGGGFGIRWRGWVHSSLSQVHTFGVAVSEIDERVRLWIDNALLIDQVCR